MGKYVNNNNITLTTPYDYDDAVSEIAVLLGVGKRENGKYALADICQAPTINPLSRCKPFRWKAHNFSDSEERARIRGLKSTGLNSTNPNNGFGSTPNVYVANYGNGTEITHGVYEYKRPRGGEDEPSRILDFDGYRHDAVSPMRVEFGAPYKDGNSVVVIYFNDIANGWNAEDCLRIEEFLDSNNADRYLGLLIVGGGYSWLLPSTKKVKDITNNSLTPITLAFGTDASSMQGNASLVNGSYLMDSNYASLATGTEIHMAIVMSNTAPPEIDSTIGIRRPLAANGDFGSLEFKMNSDRATIAIKKLASIENLSVNFSSTSWGEMNKSSVNISNAVATYDWKNVVNRLVAMTPEVWKMNGVTISITIGMANAQIYTYRHEYVGSNMTYEYYLSTSVNNNGVIVPSSNKTFEVTDLFNFLNDYVFTVQSTQSNIYGMVSISVVNKHQGIVEDEINIYNASSLVIPIK